MLQRKQVESGRQAYYHSYEEKRFIFPSLTVSLQSLSVFHSPSLPFFPVVGCAFCTDRLLLWLLIAAYSSVASLGKRNDLKARKNVKFLTSERQYYC